MTLTRRPVDNKALVSRCDATLPPPLGIADLGSATFNSTAVGGCNPCLISCSAPLAIENSTWSAVKALGR